MQIRKAVAGLALALVVPLAAYATDTTTPTDTWTSSSSSSQSAAGADAAAPRGGGPGAAVDLASVDSTDELNAVVDAAYGEGSLGLHRGHEDVQDVLTEVLGISHDELHVRMEEQGQNLAAVATDLGIDPQELVEALVESRSAAVDAALEAGATTEAQASAYREALTEAFTFRVTWDGEETTPTFAGVSA